MKTVVLMWNPAISSFHKEDLSKCIQVLGSYNEEDCPNEYLDLNWSIWDHEQVKDGDRFFMVKVGEGKIGIVMAGTIQSDPYKDKDWSGKDREVYYADLFCECIVDIETAPYISTQELKKAMPEFDWAGGHSGRVIEDSMAFKLEKMWAEYVYKYYNVLDSQRAGKAFTAGYIPDRLEEYLSKVTEGTCEICGYNYKKTWGEDCEQNNHFVRFIPRRTDQKCKNGDNVWKHFHCICPSCSQMPYKAIGEKLGEKDFFDDELWIV